jgi:hypothetical protein
MKKILIIFLSITASFIITSCQIENDFIGVRDYTPPAPPKGIYTITGDNWIEINWIHNTERDLNGYNIYSSNSYNGRYELIGTTRKNYFTDYGARNGRTYYYAVTAFDYDGNESELSADVIYDTPRPEGYNQVIFDFRRFPNNAGYDFSAYSVRRYDDNLTDMFFDNDNGIYYMVVWDDTDIQDMGPTHDIYDVSKAPLTGWSSSKDTRLREGNTYVVWTWDNHYAKFRVKLLTPERVVFDWAYQLVEGNRELKTSRINNGERKPHDITKMNERLKRNK